MHSPETLEQHRAVRENAGFAWRDDLAVLAVRGKDATSYLHSQTTNDVRALAPGRGLLAASLQPRAQIVAVYTLHRLGTEFRILVDRSRKDALLAHLEKYHVLEEVEFADLSGELRVLSLQGPRALPLLARAFPGAHWPVEEEGVEAFTSGGDDALAIRSRHTGEDGYLLACPAADGDRILGRIREAPADGPLVEIGAEALEILRLEAGIPRFGADYGEESILPETGLEARAVSYTKGCYPGQEVVARVKTYGSIGQALLGLRFSGPDLPAPGAAIEVDGKEAGRIASGVHSPSLGAPLAFAFLSRELRAAGRTIRFRAAGQDHEATVLVPPFYSTRNAMPAMRDDRREAPRSEPPPPLPGELERAGAERGFSMFRQVLAIDPRDHLANFGLGKGLLEMGRPEEALPYLSAAATIRPDHSVGYVTLGRCLERLGRIERAREVYERGIAVATRRGDLAPLKEMQSRLAALTPYGVVRK